MAAVPEYTLDLHPLPQSVEVLHRWQLSPSNVQFSPTSVEPCVKGAALPYQAMMQPFQDNQERSCRESWSPCRTSSAYGKKNRRLAALTMLPGSHLFSVGGLIVTGDQANDCGSVSKFYDGVSSCEWPNSVNRDYRRGLCTQPLGAPVLRDSVEELVVPIHTGCGLPIRKSRI
ncbi:unnamed protein product [Lota lota]